MPWLLDTRDRQGQRFASARRWHPGVIVLRASAAAPAAVPGERLPVRVAHDEAGVGLFDNGGGMAPKTPPSATRSKNTAEVFEATMLSFLGNIVV
jgi:hypothetical protein